MRIHLPPTADRQTSENRERIDRLERRKVQQTAEVKTNPDGSISYTSPAITDFSTDPPWTITKDLNASGHLSGTWSIAVTLRLSATYFPAVLGRLQASAAGHGNTLSGVLWTPSAGTPYFESNAHADPVDADSMHVSGFLECSEEISGGDDDAVLASLVLYATARRN